METLLATLQDSAYGALVRDSVFLYPLANVTHVLSVLVFFAAVAAMDLRLLRVFGGVPAWTLIDRLRPLAIGALVGILASGITLFAPEAVAIGGNPAFRLKLVLILIGLANIVLNEWALRRDGENGRLVRVSAGVSLLLWLLVAAAGRSIAYL